MVGDQRREFKTGVIMYRWMWAYNIYVHISGYRSPTELYNFVLSADVPSAFFVKPRRRALPHSSQDTFEACTKALLESQCLSMARRVSKQMSKFVTERATWTTFSPSSSWILQPMFRLEDNTYVNSSTISITTAVQLMPFAYGTDWCGVSAKLTWPKDQSL